MPWSSEEGDALLWAKVARTGFEMETKTFPMESQRKELILFSALCPSYSEHWQVGAMGVHADATP